MLGDAFFALEKWGPARSAYRTVTADSEGPMAARAQYRIGLSHVRAGEVEDAINELLKVSILYTHREWAAKATLQSADLMAAEGKPGKALKLYEEVVERFPDRDESKAAARKARSIKKEKGL